MALFGFGKKKEKEQKTSCCCGETAAKRAKAEPSCVCNGEEAIYEETSCCGENSYTDCCKNVISIKVLGAGCKSCHEQYQNVIDACTKMGLATYIQYITDMEKVMAYGVMSMPAIVVNENVVAMGKVLKATEVEKLIHKLGF